MTLLWIITGVAIVVSLAAVTPEMLKHVLSGSGPVPFLTALGIGSITLMPGFVAYSLAGLLRRHGASTATLAAFITSLMMVGILTLPLEGRFFGWRVSLVRNGLALVGAALVAAVMVLVLP